MEAALLTKASAQDTEDDLSGDPRAHRGVYLHPFVVSPDSKWRQAWDAQMVVVLVWLGVTLPYRLSFNSPAHGLHLTANLLVEVSLLVDVVVQFRTAFFDAETGVVYRDPKRIATRYLRSWAVLDIPSATPFEIANNIFSTTPSLRLLQLIRLVQIMRIARVAWTTSICTKSITSTA